MSASSGRTSTDRPATTASTLSNTGEVREV